MNGNPQRGRPELKQTQSVAFIGEQDGPPERELKRQLANFFNRASWVTTAYLARVQLDGNGSVALCVRGQPGQNRVFAERVANIFASVFGSQQYLDILWLQPEQETQLAKVCKPFWPNSAVP